MRDAPAVIARHFPEAAELYAAAGWSLPRLDRPGLRSVAAERLLGFRCRTDFAAMLAALAGGERIALRPRSLLCLAQGTAEERAGDAEAGTGDGAGLGRRSTGMQAPPRRRPRAAMELWRLDCGEVDFTDFNAFFSDTSEYPAGPKRLVGSCYLIRHGDRYLLWDTGLPGALVGNRNSNPAMTASLRARIVDQLAPDRRPARAGHDRRHQPLSFRPYRPGRGFPARAAADRRRRSRGAARRRARADRARRSARWLTGGGQVTEAQRRSRRVRRRQRDRCSTCPATRPAIAACSSGSPPGRCC